MLKFTKTECQLRLPFVIYADFETILKPEPRQNNNKATTKISRHVGSSFCTYIVSSDNRFYRAPYTYSGADAAETFVDHIIGEVSELRSILKRVESMKPLSPAQQQEYNHARKCHICKKEFNPFAEELNYRKVRDSLSLNWGFSRSSTQHMQFTSSH